MLAFHRGCPVAARTVCALLMPIAFGALVHVVFSHFDAEGLKFTELVSGLYGSGAEMTGGGALAGLLGVGVEAAVSVYGAVPTFIFALAILVFVTFHISPGSVIEKIKSRPHPAYEPEPEKPVQAEKPMAKAETRGRKRAIDIPMDEPETDAEEYVEKKVGFFNTNPRVKTPDQILEKHRRSDVETEESPAPPEIVQEEPQRSALTADDPWDRPDRVLPTMQPMTAAEPEPESGPEPDTDAAAPFSYEEVTGLVGVGQPEIKTEEIKSAEPPAPQPAARRAMNKAELQDTVAEVERTVAAGEIADRRDYVYPPTRLLNRGSGAQADGREEMAINRERIKTTLDSFGVSARISDVTRGPTVTRYDLELDAGVKLSKIMNLSGDLALSLGVTGVRIAPIPDKISTVGVEVPNKLVSTVYLRDIIESDTFKNASSRLTFAIGEDIGGRSICGNIAKLPHLLIAGTTGSGKSVCMNSLILSLLFKSSPDEVKLIMIDPKMVELGIYNGIPHLYIPVVTDPKKAAGSLQWAVVEMLKRYRLFSEIGVRDLAAYNSHQKALGEDTLPQVVIVIDELADLMMVASKEVEESVCRVAQMGRAAGLHLVIATQRPSANIITGLMKANIPSRIAFAVASGMESRIILDTQGAEKLVGSGDMLYSPIGSGKPMRIQGAFVSDEERENVVSFIKEHNSDASYNEEIITQMEKAAEDKAAASAHAESVSQEEPKSDYDELLPQAVDVILETKQASVSMLQRRLKLGYSRAARIVDQMEEIGVVGPFEGSKPRQILVTREQWQQMQGTGGEEQLHFDEYTDDEPESWSD